MSKLVELILVLLQEKFYNYLMRVYQLLFEIVTARWQYYLILINNLFLFLLRKSGRYMGATLNTCLGRPYTLFLIMMRNLF